VDSYGPPRRTSGSPIAATTVRRDKTFAKPTMVLGRACFTRPTTRTPASTAAPEAAARDRSAAFLMPRRKCGAAKRSMGSECHRSRGLFSGTIDFESHPFETTGALGLRSQGNRGRYREGRVSTLDARDGFQEARQAVRRPPELTSSAPPRPLFQSCKRFPIVGK
jgi:hypothetical protein